jgi:hypothetical protein
MFYLIEHRDNQSRCFSESYRLDVFFQNHSYGLSMFGVLLGDDGQVANLISVVVLKILQRFLKVQSDLVRDLVGRHDFFKRQYIICSSRERRERKEEDYESQIASFESGSRKETSQPIRSVD